LGGETTTTAAAVPEEALVEEEASTLTAHWTIYSPLKHDLRGQLFDEGIAKELTFFVIMMKAPRPPMLLARADEVIE
jgi:hypothetical protein